MRELQRKNTPKEVEFITKDSAYKPKVSTWGVFPRPNNISEAYGGGRTIRPGQQLEPAGDKEARRARVLSKMNEFRKETGREMEEEEIKQARSQRNTHFPLMNARETLPHDTSTCTVIKHSYSHLPSVRR